VTPIDRCIDEQRSCADYLAGNIEADKVATYGTQDQRGAMRGAEDWLMEECILRAEVLLGQKGDQPSLFTGVSHAT
jgi:hypothetical protein